MSISSPEVSESDRASVSTGPHAAAAKSGWEAALTSATVDAQAGPQVDGHPRLSKVQWQPIQGGPLRRGGFLVLGQNPRDPQLSPSVVSKVRKGAIEAQRLVDNAARRIPGHWDSGMKEAGMRIFGFDRRGPSPEEKARLAQKFNVLAQGLRGQVIVNIPRANMISGMAGVVPVKGADWGQVHMALEWIRDPANAKRISWCLLHELTHKLLHTEDTGYIDLRRFLAGGGLHYLQPVTDPMNNADSITAFAHAISA
jgi:hypothetical protein